MLTTPAKVVIPPTNRFSLMCRLSVMVVKPSVDTPAFDWKLELIATFSISVKPFRSALSNTVRIPILDCFASSWLTD